MEFFNRIIDFINNNTAAFFTLITTVVTALLTYWLTTRRRYSEIDEDKFKQVISPCMILLEPNLYNEVYKLNFIYEVKRICEKYPHYVSVQVFGWINDFLTNYTSDSKSAKKSYWELCTYFSNRYDKLSKKFSLLQRGLLYRIKRNQHANRFDKIMAIINLYMIYFIAAVFIVSVVFIYIVLLVSLFK